MGGCGGTHRRQQRDLERAAGRQHCDRPHARPGRLRLVVRDRRRRPAHLPARRVHRAELRRDVVDHPVAWTACISATAASSISPMYSSASAPTSTEDRTPRPCWRMSIWRTPCARTTVPPCCQRGGPVATSTSCSPRACSSSPTGPLTLKRHGIGSPWPSPWRAIPPSCCSMSPRAPSTKATRLACWRTSWRSVPAVARRLCSSRHTTSPGSRGWPTPLQWSTRAEWSSPDRHRPSLRNRGTRIARAMVAGASPRGASVTGVLLEGGSVVRGPPDGGTRASHRRRGRLLWWPHLRGGRVGQREDHSPARDRGLLVPVTGPSASADRRLRRTPPGERRRSAGASSWCRRIRTTR